MSLSTPNFATSTVRTARIVANRALHQTAFRWAPDLNSAPTASSSSTSGPAGKQSAGEKLGEILLESLRKSEESQAKSASNNAGSGGEHRIDDETSASCCTDPLDRCLSYKLCMATWSDKPSIGHSLRTRSETIVEPRYRSLAH
jgi:hypothetical protein